MIEQYDQTVAPTLTPISQEDIKAFVGLDGYDEYDNLLANLLDNATEAVGKRCKRQIMSSTWTLTLDHFPAEILIDKVPVTSITSIAYTDENGDAQTVDAADYQVDNASPDNPARIRPIEGTTWPSVQGGTYGTVVVTFKAGYTSRALVPKTIRHEINMITADWFRNRESDVVGTTSSSLPTGIVMLNGLNETGAYQ